MVARGLNLLIIQQSTKSGIKKKTLTQKNTTEISPQLGSKNMSSQI